MVHICIFSGHEGQLRNEQKFYLTLFGGCDLVAPTIARQIMALQRAKETGHVERPRPFFLTIFGGVEIRVPTVAEEYLDLREMLTSGALTMEQLDRSIPELDRAGASVGSLTLFGGFDECMLPKENKEIEALALHRHLGNIPEAAGGVLQYAIGQRQGERRFTVRRALAELV